MKPAMGAVALLAAIAQAQQAAPPATFRTGTRLVQVSVVAQDAAGKPVADLRREDFQVLDNGAPQQIQLFLTQQAPAAEAGTAPGAFSNNLGAGGSGGYSVLLFDNLNMDPGSTVFAHTARARLRALQALEAIPAGGKIAIYSLWCQFQVIREFTSERDSLLQQLQAFVPAPGLCVDPTGGGSGPARMTAADIMRAGVTRPDGSPSVGSMSSAPPTLGAASAAAEMASHASQHAADAAASMIADIGDREMKQMAEHLAGIPGRKNLIWLTTTFRISPANLQRLISANVAIYPVDTTGSTIALKTDKQLHAAPLRALAAATGGIAYFDRDDLDTAITEALNDGRISYTLGYYQPEEENGPPVHQIGVRVDRPDVTLRYRTSYVIEPQPPAPADPVQGFIQAMNRPVDATAVPITASATRTADRLALSVSFDISGLGFEQSGGVWNGQAEVLTRFLSAAGVQAGDTAAVAMSFTLRPASYASMLEKGARYQKEIAIPPGAAELDLLVGSIASGKLGTLRIPLSRVQDAAGLAK